MRVMVDGRVLTHDKITGVERYAQAITSALHNLVDEVIVAQPDPGSRFKQHCWEQFALPKLARKADVDILFCPANLGPMTAHRPYKQVVVLHSVSHLEYPRSYSKMFHYYYRAVIPRVLKASSAVITVSESERKPILTHYPWLEDRLVVVPSGVDKVFRPDSSQRDGSILYVGSLSPAKNLRGVLEAYALVFSRIPHRLVLVGGDGDQFRKVPGLNNLLAKVPANRIEVTGHLNALEQLRGYYSRADFLVFPSLYEASPLPPAEAMACGTPVIASDIPALRERCESAALYCDPDDPADIANTMIELATRPDLRRSLAKKGLVQAKKFSWEETARQTLKVYRNVYNKARR